jgi:hypothetical protein
MMDVGGSKDKKHMLGKKHVLTCFQLIWPIILVV